jgi:hypothetical protein
VTTARQKWSRFSWAQRAEYLRELVWPNSTYQVEIEKKKLWLDLLQSTRDALKGHLEDKP